VYNDNLDFLYGSHFYVLVVFSRVFGTKYGIDTVNGYWLSIKSMVCPILQQSDENTTGGV
jgi:hypothetical protein